MIEIVLGCLVFIAIPLLIVVGVNLANAYHHGRVDNSSITLYFGVLMLTFLIYFSVSYFDNTISPMAVLHGLEIVEIIGLILVSATVGLSIILFTIYSDE